MMTGNCRRITDLHQHNIQNGRRTKSREEQLNEISGMGKEERERERKRLWVLSISDSIRNEGSLISRSSFSLSPGVTLQRGRAVENSYSQVSVFNSIYNVHLSICTQLSFSWTFLHCNISCIQMCSGTVSTLSWVVEKLSERNRKEEMIMRGPFSLFTFHNLHMHRLQLLIPCLNFWCGWLL